jgi:hypothetical protein
MASWCGRYLQLFEHTPDGGGADAVAQVLQIALARSTSLHIFLYKNIVTPCRAMPARAIAYDLDIAPGNDRGRVMRGEAR